MPTTTARQPYPLSSQKAGPYVHPAGPVSCAAPAPRYTSRCQGFVAPADVIRTGSTSSATTIQRCGTHCGRTMANPRHMKAVTRILGPGKAANVAIAVTVWLVDATTTARATDHQQPPTITKVSATAKVRFWARRRQVTTAMAAQVTAAAALAIPTRSSITVGPLRSDPPWEGPQA